ncbi:MAG TPA: DUF2889 domain-containing protein [Acidimicrobiales bacterium]
MLDYEAWPGTLGPAVGSPARRPGSIRRTTSIDMLFPDGMTGGLTLQGRGRDLVTGPGGETEVVDRAAITVVTEGPARTVASLTLEPPVAGLDALVGAPVVAGFRKVLAQRLAEVLDRGGVDALLLDDLTGAGIVSGSATGRAAIELGIQWPPPPPEGEDGSGLPPGRRVRIGGPGPAVCIGHIPGGVMAQRTAEGRPLLGQGPPAPLLTLADDPLAWHDEPPLPPRSMRRKRRIDIWRQDGQVWLDSHFRDSHVEADGVETAVHEYEISAELSGDGLVVQHVEVRPRSLPGPECPGAAASAQRIVGEPISILRDLVRTQLRGETTCTHLNDQLRSLADVPVLLAELDRVVTGV